MSACLSFDVLVDVWSGERFAPELEDHVFACDRCGQQFVRLGKLVTALRGLVPMFISHAHRDRLAQSGMRMRFTRVSAGVTVNVPFPRDVDLLVHVLQVDTSGAESVDVDICTRDGKPLVTFEHVPFDRDAGEVLVACQRHYGEIFDEDPLFRVHTRDGTGRRVAGEYVVLHDRSGA
jgi:hypothetical protein